MDKYYLGIDTSCYTTSLGLVDTFGDIVYRGEILLKVKNGENGLRQSDAYYQHSYNLPILFEKMSKEVDCEKITSIGVSVKPRPYTESYMPVFMAGYNFAKVISSYTGVDLFLYTHQDGHFFSGIFDEKFNDIVDVNNLCVHFSGGTTEFIRYTVKQNMISSEILLATKDISFGQLIDRIGVSKGLDFPCGKEMDCLADTFIPHERILSKKVLIDKEGFNISGLENYYKSSVFDDVNDNEIFYKLFYNISNIVLDGIKFLLKDYHYSNVIFVGGVSSNKILKEKMMGFSDENPDINFIIGNGSNLRDNALGIAYMNSLGVEYHDTRWKRDFEKNY